MTGFPDFGIPYGVFGASDFSFAMNKGWRYTDDEDNYNTNSFYFSPGISAANANRIISGGGNTYVNMIKAQ